MRHIVCLILLIAAPLASAASNFTFSNPPGRHAVGLRVVQQYDYSRAYKARNDVVTGQPTKGERARPIQALVWYPAHKAGRRLTYFDYMRTAATEEAFGLPQAEVDRRTASDAAALGVNLDPAQLEAEKARPMWAVRDARPVTGKFPVVIYAPSFNAPAYENADLAEYLASHGYIVIASPNMGPHSRFMTGDLEGIETQASDIQFLVGHAHSIPEADTAHIAVAGMSWGGLSNVVAAARDSRITALVNLDGAVRDRHTLAASASYVTPARVAVPFIYLSERHRSIEELLRRKTDLSGSLMNELKYADMYQVTLHPMVHALFSSQLFRFAGPASFTDYSREERSLAYSWMARYVLAFLNAYLKNDAAGLAFLNQPPASHGAPRHSISVEVRRASGPPPTQETLAVEMAKRGFDQAHAIYQEMRKRDPAFQLSEADLNHWGYLLLRQDKAREAIEVFKLGVALYPESGNAHDSLAEAYQQADEKALAIKNYRRALELDPENHNAVQRLKVLGAAVSR